MQGPPTIIDNDGQSCTITPQEARLRNLTYASTLFVDIDVSSFVGDPNSISQGKQQETSSLSQTVMHPVNIHRSESKVNLGKVRFFLLKMFFDSKKY